MLYVIVQYITITQYNNDVYIMLFLYKKKLYSCYKFPTAESCWYKILIWLHPAAWMHCRSWTVKVWDRTI